MGVYGNFLLAFPELKERIKVWTKEDRSDERDIVAIYMTTEGGGIKRRKYTSGNTSLDIVDSDDLYVDHKYKASINVGDYFQRKNDSLIYRVINRKPYDMAAGYLWFDVERVTGATPDKDEALPVKEGYFA